MPNEIIKQNNKLSNLTGDTTITAPVQFNHLEFDGSGKWVNVATLTMAGDILPSTDATRSIGSQTVRFLDINSHRATIAKKTGAGGYTTNSGIGSITAGYAKGSYGGIGTLSSSGKGSFATGYVKSVVNPANITSSNSGAFTHGYVSSTSGTASITSSSNGGFAGGAILNNSGSPTIISSGSGSFAHGASNFSGFSITASGEGSFALGSADTTNITASAKNAFQFGPGTNSSVKSIQVGDAKVSTTSLTGGSKLMGSGGLVISSGTVSRAVTGTQSVGASVDICGQANIVAGRAVATSSNTAIIADSVPLGCVIFGDSIVTSSGTGNITNISSGTDSLSPINTSGGSGSLAHGLAMVKTGSSLTSLIKTSSSGAIAGGAAIDGGQILASAFGAIAHGCAENNNNSIISATASGAFAMGDTDAGLAITASGEGSLAFGLANTVAIIANASNSVQFGPGTNATANSLQVGDIAKQAVNAEKGGVKLIGSGGLIVAQQVVGAGTASVGAGVDVCGQATIVAGRAKATTNNTATVGALSTPSLDSGYPLSPIGSGIFGDARVHSTGTGNVATVSVGSHGGQLVHGMARVGSDLPAGSLNNTTSSIITNNDGAFAGGSAVDGGTILASGEGAIAHGSALAGQTITASAANAFQFGPGTNSTARTLQIGDIATTGVYRGGVKLVGAGGLIVSAQVTGPGTASVGSAVDICGQATIIAGRAKATTGNTATVGSTNTITSVAASLVIGDSRINSTGTGNIADVSSTGGSGQIVHGVAMIGLDGLASSTNSISSTIRTSGDGAFAGGKATSGGNILASGQGAIAHGFATTSQTITASADNSFQFGVGTNAATTSLQVGDVGIGGTTSATSGIMLNGATPSFACVQRTGVATKTLTITGAGAMVFGSMNAGGTATSVLESSGQGSFAGGRVNAIDAGVTSTIKASRDGSFAFGFATPDGGSGGCTIQATGAGSFAIGCSYAGSTIQSTSQGAFAGGRAYGGAANLIGKITSQSYGAFAFGFAYKGEITASGRGAVAGGWSNKANIVASGYGSFARGWAKTTRTANTTQITATSGGSFASGFVYSTTGANLIQSITNTGAFAFGSITATTGSANNITASGLGAVALGNITATTEAGTKTITASGTGSLAIGSATSAIAATNENSFQFGPGTNNTASSLQVGSSSMLTADGQVMGKALKMSTTAVSTTPYSVLQTGFSHLITTGANTIVCNLPSAASVGDGKMFTFTKVDAGAGSISIVPDGADLINGLNASLSIADQWTSITLICDLVGTGWVAIFNGNITSTIVVYTYALSPYVNTSADLTLTASHSVVTVDASAGDKTITLPASVAGQKYNIKKIDSSSNIVYIIPNGLQLIDEDYNYTLELYNEFVEIVGTGTGWIVISE